jgi:threonine dehydrogenase-like Zn-dependent dehydrogenase
MKAAVWHGKRDVRVETVPDPVIQEPNDAIVKVSSSGICGSDLHLYEVLGPFLEPGDVLGHEPMGVVTEVGSSITNLRPGDRVVVPFNVACGTCYTCRLGLATQCETTQVRVHGKGAALLGYTRAGVRRAGRVPPSAAGPVRSDRGAGGAARRPLRLPVRRAAHGLAGGRVRGDPARRIRGSPRPGPDR